MAHLPSACLRMLELYTLFSSIQNMPMLSFPTIQAKIFKKILGADVGCC